MAEGFITRRGTPPEPVVPFIEATGGTIFTYADGGKFYKSHTFTSSENFVVNSLSTEPDKNQVDYLIVAGGGGSGIQVPGVSNGGGGGGGGYRTTFGTQGGLGTLDSKVTVAVQSYGVTIGGGGSTQSQGQNSSVFGVSSIGGGRGGTDTVGGNGGSGGGGAGRNTFVFAGGNGTANQGFNGAPSHTPVSSFIPGGGGGAGEQGKVNNVGGDGLSSTIRNGTPEFRAGGAPDGLGGGGTANQPNGVANTGGGGRSNTGNGGSGIVIIRYEVGGL